MESKQEIRGMKCQVKRQVHSTSSINTSLHKTMNEQFRPISVDGCMKTVNELHRGSFGDADMKPINLSTKLLLREEIRKSAARSQSFSSVDTSRKNRHYSDSSEPHPRSQSFVNALISRTVSESLNL